MKMMSPRAFLLLNCASFLLQLSLLLTCTLSLLPLTLALALLILNLYHIFRALAAPQPSPYTRLFPREGRGDLSEFDKKVMESYDQSMAKTEFNGGFFSSTTHLRQSPSIEDLRKASLAEDYRSALERRENVTMREQGSAAKKIRTFFQTSEETLDERTATQLVEALAEATGKEEDKEDKKHKEHKERLRDRVGGCIRAMGEFLSGRLESEIELFVEDFEAASRFVWRCFALSLTVSRPAGGSLTPAQLRELIIIIDGKQMVPQEFTPQLSLLQIIEELKAVRPRILRLPNFTLGPTVLRTLLGLKYLRKELGEEVAVMAGFCREEAPAKDAAVIREDESGRLYCNRYPQLRTTQAAVVLLVAIAKCLRRHPRSPLSRSLLAEIDCKYA